MNCNFIYKDDKYRCEKCGFSTKVANLKRNCTSENNIYGVQLQIAKQNNDILFAPFNEPQKGPPILPQRLANFGKSWINHILKGSPTCTDEQILERLTICSGCPLFKKYTDEPLTGVCTHESCGCNISSLQKYLNKLAWQDQRCPIDKWGPISNS